MAPKRSRSEALLRLAAITTNLALYCWVLAIVAVGYLEFQIPPPELGQALANFETPAWVLALAIGGSTLSVAGIRGLLSQRPLGRLIVLVANAALFASAAIPIVLAAFLPPLRSGPSFFLWLHVAIVLSLALCGSALLLTRPVAHSLFGCGLTYQALSCRLAAAGGSERLRFRARRYQRSIGRRSSRSAAAPC